MLTKKNLTVSIRGVQYPVVKAGQGIPCLFICLGSPSFRTISKEFAKYFEIYSSDVYWVENAALQNPEQVTIDRIVDDIKILGDALKLRQYVIFAHSAYGLIAIEFAKKYPDVAAAIIMVGTPVNSNLEVAKENELIFQQTADELRKQIDSERRAEVAKEDLSQLTPSKRWAREYIYRDAPRYWHVPDFDCTALWEGVNIDKLLGFLFTDILPKVDVLKDLEQVKTPIYLAAGMSDYDCCPWQWKNVPNLPSNFTIHYFTKSGHYPHFEEPDLFNARVIAWVENVLGKHC